MFPRTQEQHSFLLIYRRIQAKIVEHLPEDQLSLLSPHIFIFCIQILLRNLWGSQLACVFWVNIPILPKFNFLRREIQKKFHLQNGCIEKQQKKEFFILRTFPRPILNYFLSRIIIIFHHHKEIHRKKKLSVLRRSSILSFRISTLG